MVKCRSTQWDSISACGGVEPVESHRLLVEGYDARVMSRKQMWIRRNAFDTGKRDADEKHCLARPSTFNEDDNASSCKCPYQTRQTHYAYNVLKLHISLVCAHSTAHDQLDYRRCAHAGCRRTSDDHKAHRAYLSLMHLARYADQGQQFMQCTVTGNETWVSHATPEIKESIHDLQIPSIAPTKKFKPTPSVRKIMATVFWRRGGGVIQVCCSVFPCPWWQCNCWALLWY
jgi:hypothetical protein